MGENNPIIGEKDYILLKDFKVETEVDEEKGFILCFWVYIFDSKTFPATILKQVYAETNTSSSLLVLNETTLTLLPLACLHNEAPGPGNTELPSEVPKVTAAIERPQHKWIHIGYEASSDFVRLYVNGEIAGELLLSSMLNQDSIPNGSRKRTLIGISGDSNLEGFIHDAMVLPSMLSIKDQYVKDPPLRLSIDESSISDIEEDNGFWNIVGGKASCRRIFSLDVVLLNAFGQLVNKEVEVVASLLYAHNRLPVEKTNDEEPPLLAGCDGIEFASSDRPSKLSKGRASFKLKISKLSSKCDNRQFCIKSILLKEIATTISDDEISGFADQVSVYSGCSHHRHQIKMAKRLIDEGTIAWNSISQNNLRVQWESAVFEIEEQFMKIACCTTRSLSQQDFELLRKIAGCQDYMAQENFEKMWCWLYPVALTLSSDRIKAMWKSTSPKWIEGFITKEEAELSLQGPRGLQEPGTFILRFPTSRSWPHPDAGSLVVTYVGNDYALHHRLLYLDNVYSSGVREVNVKVKPLQDMLFEEPELSRLGRITRRH
ncbi:SH2 domain protein A, putative isoform 2 [Hibiscus syriacus]|uniref:SH2 domain protein A, putative isoform 2 n=1 Tax=Hibiscus syriacus TaxID=106335 RepID=A0A6A3BP40_HIBSY|nr:SH2 domain protein A, putative isoform 2 [Hibiscus syriacus]